MDAEIRGYRHLGTRRLGRSRARRRSRPYVRPVIGSRCGPAHRRRTHLSELQLDRVQEASRLRETLEPQLADARLWGDSALFVLCLRQARRFGFAIAQLPDLDEHQRLEVASLVEKCESAAPGIRAARNWIDHLDGQLRGTSKELAPVPLEIGNFLIGTSDGIVHGFSVGGIVIDVRTHLAAVQSMARGVLDLLPKDV